MIKINDVVIYIGNDLEYKHKKFICYSINYKKNHIYIITIDRKLINNTPYEINEFKLCKGYYTKLGNILYL